MLDSFDFLNFKFVDLLDIVLVGLILYYIYRLLKGTVAISIFLGIVIIFVIWKITQIVKMELVSGILGQFINVGFFALIVVFQQEIRKFLLVIGSTNVIKSKKILFPKENYGKLYYRSYVRNPYLSLPKDGRRPHGSTYHLGT